MELFRAAAQGVNVEDEVECFAPDVNGRVVGAGQPGTVWLRLSATHPVAGGRGAGKGFTEWRIQDVTEQVHADIEALAHAGGGEAEQVAQTWPGPAFSVDIITGELTRLAQASSGKAGSQGRRRGEQAREALGRLDALLVASNKDRLERIRAGITAGIPVGEIIAGGTVVELLVAGGNTASAPLVPGGDVARSGTRGAAQQPASAKIKALLLPGSTATSGLLLVMPSPETRRRIASEPAAVTEPAGAPLALDRTAYDHILETAPIAIAKVGADGVVARGNAAFERMFGGSDGTRSPSSLLDRLETDCREQVRQALARAISGEGASGPVEIAFGEETRQVGRLYVSPLSDPAAHKGEMAIVYAIDLSKQRELEVRFAQSQKMQAVGQLAGGMAHDFNNVLTTIILSSDFLLSSHPPSDPAHKDIMAIKQNASRAAGIVRQLLAFSRQQTLRPRVLSLTDIISDWSMWLSRILEEKIELRVSHGRDLWYVKADQTQFEQVIMNLAVNARDAMPDGGCLTIRTYNLSQEASRQVTDDSFVPGEYVACEVSDTGCGMSAEIKEKIFEPFFSTKEIGKGTGLGLATVYGIIKQTGGYIFCDTKPGEGTTFRIYLPRHLGAEQIDEAPARSGQRGRPRDLTGTGTVLLVEDEEAVRRFAARALTRQGYKVIEAGTGAEALQRMDDAEGMVDLVVSDIMMPEMDGPTLLKRLRSTNPDLKFIFISGYAEDALKSLDERDEFSFLPKPFQLKDLVTTVKEVLEK
ncbi:MAG: response regulator [Rhizobiales bacterium]|nr:response regulator [Hyphomicrobiales bacterium]